MPSTIEDVILQKDRRGISGLRVFLPADFCHQAARFVQQHLDRVVITTGFYIPGAQAPETDGPPGAIALGRALQGLGASITYVSDRFALPLLASEAERGATLVEFPIADEPTSAAFAARLLGELRPSLLIAVERPGRTADGRYLTMHGLDITPFTARIDLLFEAGIPSIGIGDGGNEIGMGALAKQISQVGNLVKQPAATSTTHLLLASVSNWGAYGLLAALSRQLGRDLLPAPDGQRALLRQLVSQGAVDGTTGKRTMSVDSFSVRQETAVLRQLHRAVVEQSSGA